ncbi:EamA/RhaT family transporter [Nakamurella antarctica]|uniref:EamA/RhaT family transporter n=1 Tax=Nakamurella antarctica TaxID=1902245 RepID=A0A3G8ZLK9_9ACTN|nr:EamA family transporter [Nakamurella antarctica]AZI58222.1 EamA/RhaT family transporter [Nakamurella antarctica]
MTPRPLFAGQMLAIVAAVSFGLSGPFIKPVLESGWTPAAAVTVRALIGGLVLAPFAAMSVRGKWRVLWDSRWRILGMAGIGVAGTQLLYFAAVQRIPVGTAILIEYLAPLLLVAIAWIATRRTPRAVVLGGSVIALAGLLMVISPDGSTRLDILGLIFAVGAMVGCAMYYLIAARPPRGLPSVALAASGLLIGAVLLGAAGLAGVLPFRFSTENVMLLGTSRPWWVPMLVVGVLATALAYAASVMATERLGSRLASFLGLLEVAAAAVVAWILLGESLTVFQIAGGVLILLGIGCVRSDRSEELAGQLDIGEPEVEGGTITSAPRRAKAADPAGL